MKRLSNATGPGTARRDWGNGSDRGLQTAMPRALQPFTPFHDIEARRRWAGPVVAGVLTRELAEFCQSGISIVIAARDAGGKPVAGTAKACRITSDGRMRIFLAEPANAALLAAFAQGSPVAATFSAPRTHRSIQVKSSSARKVDLEEGDPGETLRQVRAFAGELVFVNYTQRFASAFTAYRPDEIVAVEFSPEEAFVQTPGPGAGEQLAS